MEYEEIKKVFSGKLLRVNFYDGTFIYLIKDLPNEKKFIGVYTPCRDYPRQYKVNPEEIKEIVLEDPQP